MAHSSQWDSRPGHGDAVVPPRKPRRPHRPHYPANNAAQYPELIDETGNPIDSARAEDAIEAHEPGLSNSYQTTALPPLGWNHGRPDNSRMVGWTLHKRGQRDIVEQHAFNINPQAITRVPSTRNQLFATQGGFYVDDFGPGSETIQLTQLVAHGRASAGAGGSLVRSTMREDVLRFYDHVYIKAVSNPGRYDVYFHDNHLWETVSGRTPERVYFPPQAFQLARSVQQHNVWQLQLQMMTLDPPPGEAAAVPPRTPGQPKLKVYVVKRGDTLKKIAARLAGKRATHQQVLKVEKQIIALTKRYGKDDITKARTIPTWSATNPQQHIGDLKVNRNHLAPGEKIYLPSR